MIQLNKGNKKKSNYPRKVVTLKYEAHRNDQVKKWVVIKVLSKLIL